MRTKLEDYTRFPLGAPIAGSAVDPLSLGYVYVIGFEEAGIVKIGSAAAPGVRLMELQCGNPFELRLKAAVSIYDGAPVLIELAAHKLAADYCIRGEWFELTTDEALRFIIKAARNAKAKFGAAVEALEHEETERLARIAGAEQAEASRRERLRQKLGME